MEISKFIQNALKQFDGNEIDIRSEVSEFFHGDDFGESKMSPFIFRKLRKSTSGVQEKCTCFNNLTNEGTLGCPYCDGLGYLWDESIISGMIFYMSLRKLAALTGYEVPYGRSKDFPLRFITTNDIDISIGDVIYELDRNNDGFITTPVVRVHKLFVLDGSQHRLDYGQTEYTSALVVRN